MNFEKRKPTKRIITALTTIVMVALLFSGCKGGDNQSADNKTTDNGSAADQAGNNTISDNDSENGDISGLKIKTWKTESIAIDDGTTDIKSISGIRIYEDKVYFMADEMPEYPQEYYDDMKKLEGSEEGIEAATEKKESGSESTEKKKAKEDKTNDEDLLGDIDDIFGNGADSYKSDSNKKTDPADKDKSDDSDNDKVKTYDDLLKKYSEYQPKKKMFKYDTESKEGKELFLLDTNDGRIYDDYCISKAGNIVFLIEQNIFDETTNDYHAKYTLEEYGEDGSIFNSSDITEQIDSDNKVSSDEDCLGKVKLVDENRIIIEKGRYVFRFNSKGELLGKIKTDKLIDSLAVDPDGNLVIYGMDNDGKMCFVKADLDSYKIGDKIEGIVEGSGYVKYNLLDGGCGHSFYLMDSVGLYSYDYDTEEKKEILGFMDAGLVGNLVDTVIPMDDGRVLYSCNNPDDGSADIGFISKSEEAESREVITLMTLATDDIIQKKITNYNKSDNKYKINLITFENEENPVTSMNNQIIAGNIPDILDIANIDIKNILSKNILEDITPYVLNDDKINKEYFIDGYLNAVKSDGKIYYLGDSFSLNTIVGKESELKKYMGRWTIRELMEYYRSKKKGTKLFPGNTKENVFYQLAIMNIEDYIDWDEGKVSFDGEDFRELLEFCNLFPLRNDDESGDLNINDMRDGRVLLNNEYIYNTQEMEVDKKLFDNDYVYIGFPGKEGGVNYLNLNHAYGICSGTKNKDSAWEIIKMLITKPVDMSEAEYVDSGIPADKEGFEEFVKRETATEKYTDKNGNEVLPRDSSYSYSNFAVKLGPATDDMIEKLKQIIKGSRGIGSSGGTVSDMLIENVNPYFEGKRSLDDTVRILQDKMDKYINENK